MSKHQEPALVLLDKPAGMTSFDCVREVKRVLNRSDVGHGGTLDKFATGLLPILVGEGLKLVRFFLESYPTLPTYWKHYSGVIELGKSTDTGDPEGAVTQTLPVPPLNQARVESAMRYFVENTYEQVPPNYSAKKIGGERASELARKGQAVDLKSVKVIIQDFRCVQLDGNRIHFEARCSKGAYIRVLAQDLAKRLETVGYVTKLKRTGIGDWRVDQATPLEQFKTDPSSALDLQGAAAFLPTFALLTADVDHLRVGKIDNVLARLANSGLSAGVYCAVSQDQPMALLELDAQKRATFLRAFA